MTKGISEDAQVHISIAMLVKVGILVAVVTGGWYQSQMQFANIEARLNDLHDEVVILSSKVGKMEAEHIEELEHHNEELIETNRSLMQRLGLKKP
tara:strand:- start:141 stop:425 length:285 start_codon:yes stop_codon:yes gene_type:complete